MPGPIIVTTSWDDGHPKDLRIAEELQGRALSGSFFVPLTGLGGKPTLTPGDLRCLRHQGFEIGAHTVSHKSLAGLKGRLLRFEVSYCKQKLEQILGADVTMFCYPNGRYDRNVVRHVREAGFRGARTTRMLSLEHKFSPFEMPTSLQAFPHPWISYLKNLGKNGDTPGLFRYLLEYHRSNHEVSQNSFVDQLALAKRTIWASDTRREFRELLLREKPHVVHVHNTFVMISPSVYWACHDAQTPVVQTLHNYRLLCPAGNFLRNGEVCEECVQHSLLRGVRYGCYRGSQRATASVALMLMVHRWRKTWTRMVDCYIALSESARKKFREAGLPAAKLTVKPNFVSPDPGMRMGPGDYAVFVGRLSLEKGLSILLAAWGRIKPPLPLLIVGDGNLRAQLNEETAKRGLSTVAFCGQMPHRDTLAILRGARFLVYPSECYEQCPLTILEAYACGVPVIASALGGMQELVDHGRTGILFRPVDPEDLAEKVQWAWSHVRETLSMGKECRAEYEARYSAQKNYQTLINVYRRTITVRARTAGSVRPLVIADPRGAEL